MVSSIRRDFQYHSRRALNVDLKGGVTLCYDIKNQHVASLIFPRDSDSESESDDGGEGLAASKPNILCVRPRS